MKAGPGVFTSNIETWETPLSLFEALDAEFDFTLDPCASHATAKCDRYLTEADDGLTVPWAPHRVFMNPPYGRTIGHWVAKAHKEAIDGALAVCLIPARTDTAYWHDHVMSADEVRFIRGRLHFGGAHEATAHNAPFPSCVAIFRPPRQQAADRTTPLMTGMDRP